MSEHSAENGPPVPLPIGTVIRLNTDPGDEWDAMPNRNYIITAHVPHDPADNDPPADCYEVEPAPGQGYWSSGEYAPYIADLTVVRSAEAQAGLMKMPTPDELAEAISSSLHDMFGQGLEVYETQVLTEKATGDAFEVPSDFGHGVEFYGRRENGVGFGGTLRLTGLWRTDD